MTVPVIKKIVATLLLAVAAGQACASELIVSAASSLTNAFEEIARSYQKQHSGTRILLNFGASGTLLQQLVKGAPVDVFASADQDTMDAAEKQGLVTADYRHNFVRNSLVLIVPSTSKKPIYRLEDLNTPVVTRFAMGNPAVDPSGRYARRAMHNAGLWSAVSSKAINGENVRQALEFVVRSEVDSGFVYATDAALMKDKVRVVMAVPIDMVISFPIANTSASTNVEEARRFIDYVLSPTGQAILNKYGFLKP